MSKDLQILLAETKRICEAAMRCQPGVPISWEEFMAGYKANAECPKLALRLVAALELAVSQRDSYITIPLDTGASPQKSIDSLDAELARVLEGES